MMTMTATWRRNRPQDAVRDYDRIRPGDPVHGSRPRMCRECNRAAGSIAGKSDRIVREGSSVTHLLHYEPRSSANYAAVGWTWCGRAVL